MATPSTVRRTSAANSQKLFFFHYRSLKHFKLENRVIFLSFSSKNYCVIYTILNNYRSFTHPLRSALLVTIDHQAGHCWPGLLVLSGHQGSSAGLIQFCQQQSNKFTPITIFQQLMLKPQTAFFFSLNQRV